MIGTCVFHLPGDPKKGFVHSNFEVKRYFGRGTRAYCKRDQWSPRSWALRTCTAMSWMTTVVVMTPSLWKICCCRAAHKATNSWTITGHVGRVNPARCRLLVLSLNRMAYGALTPCGSSSKRIKDKAPCMVNKQKLILAWLCKGQFTGLWHCCEDWHGCYACVHRLLYGLLVKLSYGTLSGSFMGSWSCPSWGQVLQMFQMCRGNSPSMQWWSVCKAPCNHL
jgi:hypothetical protein